MELPLCYIEYRLCYVEYRIFCILMGRSETKFSNIMDKVAKVCFKTFSLPLLRNHMGHAYSFGYILSVKFLGRTFLVLLFTTGRFGNMQLAKLSTCLHNKFREILPLRPTTIKTIIKSSFHEYQTICFLLFHIKTTHKRDRFLTAKQVF